MSYYFRDEQLVEITLELKSSAKSIRKTEVTTKHGIAQFLLHMMEWIESKSFIWPVSVMIIEEYKKLLEVKEYVCFSSSCALADEEIVIQPMSFTQKEIGELKSAYHSIFNNH
ncbi:MAG: hypothetical protein RLO81_03945 [Fulvivirga sp.]|uniref:hypothetical protein n=1 Tax=Fulvivirga sp. TaxID=1931237 RepID=UPI0032EF83A8